MHKMSNALSVIASNTGSTPEEIKDVLKGMIVSAKNQHGATATDAELTIVSSVCAKYDLNPLVKECAAFVSGGKLQMIVMIDGWYRIVNRQPDFDGVELEDKFDDKGNITATTCKMYLKNRSHPVVVTEYMAECRDEKSSVWRKWPARMLRHKAYIQAARMAFGISEMVDDDEASRITGNSQPIKDVTPQKEVEPVNLDELRQRMLAAKDNNELREISGTIRQELESIGQWAQHKADVVLMNRETAEEIERRNAADDEVVVEFDEETGEVIDGQ
jgi:hypothetical protein